MRETAGNIEAGEIVYAKMKMKMQVEMSMRSRRWWGLHLHGFGSLLLAHIYPSLVYT
jgi:hypothetical protein